MVGITERGKNLDLSLPSNSICLYLKFSSSMSYLTKLITFQTVNFGKLQMLIFISLCYFEVFITLQ